MVVHQDKTDDCNACNKLADSNAIYSGDEILVVLKNPWNCISVCTNVEISGLIRSPHIFPPFKLIDRGLLETHLKASPVKPPAQQIL
jgi:hypothetical protein